MVSVGVSGFNGGEAADGRPHRDVALLTENLPGVSAALNGIASPLEVGVCWAGEAISFGVSGFGGGVGNGLEDLQLGAFAEL